MHVAAVQFDNPGVTIQFDSDAPAAARQRELVFADAAYTSFTNPNENDADRHYLTGQTDTRVGLFRVGVGAEVCRVVSGTWLFKTARNASP